MDTTTSVAEKVTGLLQSLDIDSYASIGDTSQVLPNTNVGGQGGLDRSRADGFEGYGIEPSIHYTPHGYPPSHGYYIEGGFGHPTFDWDDYRSGATAETLERLDLDSLNEINPAVYHPSGFAYPQHIYALHGSETRRRGHGQSTASHGISHIGNVYQSSALSNALNTTTDVEALKKSPGESSNKWLFHIIPSNDHGHMGSHGRVLPPQPPSSQDVRVGYGGNKIETAWSDSFKVAERQQWHGSSSSSIFGCGRPLAPLLPIIPSDHVHHRPISEAATPGSYGRWLDGRKNLGSANPARIGTITGLDSHGHGNHWPEWEKGKSWSRGGLISNNGRLNWDISTEQNKGPRTARGRQQRTTAGASRCSQSHDLCEPVNLSLNKDELNRPDFVTSHDRAKFFIIKSYSEDDIHKSIKYSIWASTVNGNKKLDTAYREGQASSRRCPLFLFFSVNASGQFCGVAEMVGPVDFNSSADCWQQDKWTGKVPVKWHIVKDVPNSQFRHIILENNDNKPVTNSRDTQEVPLSQGSEMLNIFKTHGQKTSILDDFFFYETRQRFLQEKKARQKTHVELKQANCTTSKRIYEKLVQKDDAQCRSLITDAGRCVDQMDNLSQPTEVTDTAGRLKGVSESNHDEAA